MAWIEIECGKPINILANACNIQDILKRTIWLQCSYYRYWNTYASGKKKEFGISVKFTDVEYWSEVFVILLNTLAHEMYLLNGEEFIVCF